MRNKVLSLEDVMKYELSPFPPALFEARKVLRKPDKPQLAIAITKASRETHEATRDAQPKIQHYVLETYGSIAQSYAEFTIRRYPSATVVFDRYLGGPTIKDNTHQRRGKNVHPVISFTEETVFAGKKDEFLSRDRNKQNMIDLISEKLRGKGCEVINAPVNADVQIVKAAVLSSLTRSTTLIGEDTDMLILLLHYMQQANKDLYFRSDNELKIVLGEELCSKLLFLHAYTGCDTTSRIFGVGKKYVFHKLVKGDATLKRLCQFLPSSKADCSIHCEQRLSSDGCDLVWLEQESDMNTCEWGWKREGSQFVPTDYPLQLHNCL